MNTMDNVGALLNHFPQSVAKELSDAPSKFWRSAQELRFRRGHPALMVASEGEYAFCGQTLRHIENNTLNNIINKFLNYSDYAYPQEMSSGYVAIPGGHRAGFCGQAVLEAGKLHSVRDISSVNVRIARELPQAAERIWPQLLDREGKFGHTLIASPPGCGKTTLLRSLVRKLSESGYNVSVCDERNEISGAGYGTFAFDLGRRTDVMSGCPKAQAMVMLLRSMGPQVMATDETGTEEEVAILRRAIASGVVLLTTAHAADLRDLLRSPLSSLVAEQAFFRIVFLSDRPAKGTVTSIWKREQLWKSNV